MRYTPPRNRTLERVRDMRLNSNRREVSRSILARESQHLQSGTGTGTAGTGNGEPGTEPDGWQRDGASLDAVVALEQGSESLARHSRDQATIAG